MAVERTISIIKPDAVAKHVIGEIYTRFEKDAAPGTIRPLAKTVDENAVYGPDGPDTAKAQIAYYFKDNEICPRTRE